MKAVPILVVLALLPHAAAAQELADPMRPPAAAPVAVAPSAPRGESRPGLQTILISATRRIAIIDNKQVEIGSRIRGGEVVAINPNEVVIRSRGRTRVLELVPGASKEASTSRRASEPTHHARADLSVFGARKDLRISRLGNTRIQQAYAKTVKEGQP